LALAVLAAKREGPSYSGPWQPIEPDPRDLSPFHPDLVPEGVFGFDDDEYRQLLSGL
jgi:hypothetical protein